MVGEWSSEHNILPLVRRDWEKRRKPEVRIEPSTFRIQVSRASSFCTKIREVVFPKRRQTFTELHGVITQKKHYWGKKSASFLLQEVKYA
jgi:hypothetical protein